MSGKKSQRRTGIDVAKSTKGCLNWRRFCFATCAAVIAVSSARAAQYDLQSVILTENHTSNYVYGVNDLGTIVGFYTDQTGVSHSYIQQGPTGNTTSFDFLGATATFAHSINNDGWVSGSYVDAGGASHGFTKIGDTFSSFDVEGALNTYAYGINNLGAIVGSYTDVNGVSHGFVKTGDTFNSFDFENALNTYAFGINDSGVVAGTFEGESGLAGFLKQADNFTTISFTSALGTLSTAAFAVNNTGVVVGSYIYDGSTRPFGPDSFGVPVHSSTFAFYDNTFTELPTQAAVPNAGYARGINSSGQIVVNVAPVFGQEGYAYSHLLLPSQPTIPPVAVGDLVEFSEAAYTGALAVGGWAEITEDRITNSPGYTGRAYINNARNQIVLAIAGSDDLVDWLGVDPTFFSPTGQSTETFRAYLKSAVDQIQFLRESPDYKDAQITVTGHSLGGAIAQLIGNAGGIRAVSFNGSGPGLTLNDSEVVAILGLLTKESDAPEIVNYRTYGDLVSTVGQQLGNVVTFEPPVPRFEVDALPVGTAKAMHDLQILFERIYSNASTTTDTGPTVESIAAHTIVLRGTRGTAILALTNVVVLLGDAYWHDPSGADVHSYFVDPDGPLIKSLQFPLLTAQALFKLEVFVDGEWQEIGLFPELGAYDFGPEGTAQFRFSLLDETSLSALSDVEPFAFGVSFLSDGVTNVTLESSSSVPEPRTWLLAIVSFWFVASIRRKTLRMAAGLYDPSGRSHSVC
ncbi:MAG: hypothetical protein U1E87_01670 [Alphaproteobacteria bacterium]